MRKVTLQEVAEMAEELKWMPLWGTFTRFVREYYGPTAYRIKGAFGAGYNDEYYFPEIQEWEVQDHEGTVLAPLRTTEWAKDVIVRAQALHEKYAQRMYDSQGRRISPVLSEEDVADALEEALHTLINDSLPQLRDSEEEWNSPPDDVPFEFIVGQPPRPRLGTLYVEETEEGN